MKMKDEPLYKIKNRKTGGNITGKEEKEIPPSFFVSKLRHMSPSVRKPTIAKYDTAFLGRVSGDT